ncbi:MAG: DUF481 domain-containing protein [Planctomycetes bacterium]|nr:DUF481 domain-containing protein [Planctomycetota bacterium]
MRLAAVSFALLMAISVPGAALALESESSGESSSAEDNVESADEVASEENDETEDESSEDEDSAAEEEVSEPELDRVTFADGTVLRGTLNSMTFGKLRFGTSFAGELEFPFDKIETLESGKDQEVRLESGSLIVGSIETVEPFKFRIVGADAKSSDLGIGDIKAINFKPLWVGNFNLGFSAIAGNRYSQRLESKLDLSRRGLDDRLSADALALWGRTKDDATNLWDEDVRKFAGGLKYDYFFYRDVTYVFAQTKFLSDKFADLDLRSQITLGLGCLIVENETASLDFELGLNVTDEDRRRSPDDTYTAVASASHLRLNILSNLTFNFTGELVKSLENGKDLLTYLEASLLYGFDANWSIGFTTIWQNDKNPPPGIERTDVQYLLEIAYTF